MIYFSIIVRPDNFETPSRASATINDPDWEHFDEIEAYTSNDDSGLLVRILPSIIYKHFLTPTDADADTVRHDREQISSCFDEIVEVHAQACQELDNTDQQEKIDTEVGDSQNYPVTADDLDDYNSLSTYLDEAKQLVECERDVHRLITHLLTKPEKAFLTSEEQAVLTETKEFFSRSATKGEERIEELRSRRRKLLEVLPDKTREWEHELNSLEAQAEPYLRLDEYLEDDNLLRKTRALEDELSSFAESNPVFTELSPRIKSQFFDLRERAQRLNSKLPETRSKYAENQFKCLTNSVQRRIDQLQERLQPSKEAGDPIQAPDEILTEIQNLQSKLSEFENRPLNKQFTDTQDNRLAGFEEILADLKRFTQEKQRFDSKIDNHMHTFQALSTDAEPYLNYDEYLPHRTREALIDRLIQFDAVMQEFVHKTQLSILSQHDADRVNNLQQQYSTIREHLDGYNSTFVRRQRENCTEIFSNIGSEDLELTVEQERAVIRNGIYNQVIAAAGTGKTLTLTTRVAYLIEQQNVDPADILVVTYTNEATEEMSERLEDQFGITNVTIETIHAFGYDLIQETQEQFVEPIDQNERQNFVDQQIREARNKESSAFLDHYYEFLVHFDDVYYDETEFETRKAYVEARLEETYVTLKGTEVKSRAEKLIADFLFTNQVEYRYEDRATWAESTRDKAGYTPDFYLPNHDLYIEHWGIDETGSVAPWFSQSSAEYREKIQWAHQQFSGTEHTLIGTYEFEHEANYLKQALRHRLTHHGVELTQLRFEELIDTAFEYDQREGWIKRRFGTFIENAKRFEMKPDDIKPHLSEENPRQYHFGYCGIHLLQQYEMYLTQNNLIDFQDMVHDAVDTIQQNPTSYKEQYEHVLVDEFQDIGKGKLELIQQLTGDDAARLFAVGDDWQSIYSFQGAVIDYFTEFSTYFGDPVP